MKYSFLMSTYINDDFGFLKASVLSVISLLRSDCEFIIIGDGPLEKSALEFLIETSASNSRVQFLPLEKNIGLTGALNFGLNFCSGEWVIRCDADDISLQHRLDILSTYSTSGVDIVSTFTAEFDPRYLSASRVLESWEESCRLGFKIKSIPISFDEIRSFALFRNPVNHNSAAIRLESLRNVGGYADVPFKEDYATWLKMIGSGYTILGIPTVTVLVSAGLALSRRRGGFIAIKSEFAIFRYQINYLPQSKLLAALRLILRIGFIVTPSRIKLLIYSFLRQGKKL